MRVIRAAECCTMPWKNGGGETTEIAVFPRGASLDTFDWRISGARVASDGPFSAFPGIDRTLTVLDGKGMRLSLADGNVVDLDPSSPPFAFDGGMPVDATLVDGPVADLNVMTRRGTIEHEVMRLQVVARSVLPVQNSPFVVYCIHGTVRLTSINRAFALGTGDALIRDAVVTGDDLALEGTGELLLVILRSLGGTASG